MRAVLVVGLLLAAAVGVTRANAARGPTTIGVGVTGANAAPGPTTTGVQATRAGLARQHLVDRRGRHVDGTGSSIAIIDTGIDPTHPALSLPGGGSKVVTTMSAVPCIVDGVDSGYTSQIGTDPSCVVPVPAGLNIDAGHGGHGSMVGGIAVGDAYTLADGTRVGGIAPGARLVVISTTAALIGIDNAFAWILAHHAAPCGPGVPATTCPPIRAVNCSWGANSPVILKLQDALAKVGVVTVWANGNGGGDGSTNHSNQTATEEHTGGVISVASYDDLGTGTRDGKLSSTSSRGQANRPSTWPDVSAPGVNMISSCRPYQAICPTIETEPPRSGPGPGDEDTYFIGSGTSFAAPVIAGIVTMLFQVDPDATSAQVVSAITSTAYRYHDGAPYRAGSSFDKGAGLVDAYAAALRMGAHRV